ncbi:hypothetical protein A3I99_00690 [Candidatus Kaiserbacteria bacterium RIFCSPLOWO2_02_FULL_45_11b]|uniref:Uncharacterized protein n=1 Tax=Candidatus Kaiserbacteria bacterium RIFCSPLOWO2_12_FULL_45_26 TaxID=1798525 RepID=A0A1F6FG69_9BACT|nr:MAG: hypothetical protein A2929_01105 [Candidatus Kaiserbacteria bacterium RIFCSPLOWO2_01_FULL_45_25]OGG84290.1 MAG: hypothetical protein A3I99_00690 [Candidatus Kaiserbacteria bacterium RIFCSPLOWO2_02_FULL_45_11b]OGG84857.1 MAG: hypothetical protein A3G90_02145 [Candidatus Kaiserbacteria bacterium RIFCSPLOWO2_12_FULL_45_26]
MKAQLLISLALVALPVQAKIDHNKLIFSDWELLSKDVIVLPNFPRYPVQLYPNDLGAVMACRMASGRIIHDGVVTKAVLHLAVNGGLVYCAAGQSRFWFPE